MCAAYANKANNNQPTKKLASAVNWPEMSHLKFGSSVRDM